MISALDRLQLRPNEKRLIVVGGMILFVMVNFWFVWPHYGDLGRIRAQIRSNEDSLTQYRTELARTNQYLARLQLLESDGGAVLTEDKDITLLSTVQTVARESGITPANITPAPRAPRGGTNAFFEQRALTITLNPTPPEPLLRFLVSLATNQVVLRVKELDLKKDGTQTKLQGSLRVVASFQRQPLAPKAAPVSTRPNPLPRT